MISFYVLVLIGSVLSCKSSSNSTESPRNQNFASIEMIRTPCMHPCPSYEIRVFEDGSAEFIGKENTQYLGKYEGKVDPEFNRILWKSVRNADLEKKKNKYGMGNEDTQQISIRYSGQDFNKEIIFQSFEPIEINEIEQNLKIIAENTTWTKPQQKDQ